MLMKNQHKNGTIPSGISSAKVYWMDTGSGAAAQQFLIYHVRKCKSESWCTARNHPQRNGREKRRKNFNGSVFKDPQPSRASPPTSLVYHAKTYLSQWYGRRRRSATQRGRKSRWHCTESEVQREQRAANKAQDR